MRRWCRYRADQWLAGITILFLAGCSGLPIDLSENEPGASGFAAPPHDELLVGLAVSGGGSRAANFTAEVLKALAKVKLPSGGSLLEEIDYVSSVSGGSLASAYYVVKKPGRAVPTLTPEAELSPAYTAFFEQFQADMRTNINRRLLLTPKIWRWARVALTGYSRSRMLGDLWDDLFFDGATFRTLYDREQRGDVPRLLINGTSRNDGRRFVFSSVGPRDLQFNLTRCLGEPSSGSAELTTGPSAELRTGFSREIRRRQFVFLPWTFAKLHSDISQFRIAQAAAASASFPVALSHMLLRDFTPQAAVSQPATRNRKSEILNPQSEIHKGYYNITDGGVFDNQGIETLAQLFLHRLFEVPEGERARRALIIVIDASYPFELWTTGAATRSELPISELERDFGIMERRAIAYQYMLWAALTAKQGEGLSSTTIGEQGRCPVGERLTIIRLQHACERCWAANEPVEVPPSCSREPWVASGRVDGRRLPRALAAIPTDFKISTCHADLLALSAKAAVDSEREAITGFFSR